MKTLLLALALQCPDGTPPPCRAARATAAPAFSVAVLSFENRSRDSADVSLGDGLADEIATQLGGVQRLTVRSRTMVRRLAGAQTMAPPALGRALGAAFLVDGSIQRAGAQLRVQVQLLRSASGDQAWAQTYDRPADDLFRIQSEIARSVSEAIAGRLLPQERAQITRAPTRNPAAYELYVRTAGVSYGAATDRTQRAIAQLEEAVTLDSTFAEAWARLARLRLNQYWLGTDFTGVNLASAFGAAQRAARLAPNLPEAHVAMAYYHYWGSRNYGEAIRELTAALRLRPNDAESWAALANVSRRQGLWDQSVEQRQRAIALDPQEQGYRVNLAMTLWSMRRWNDALAATDSAELRGADTLKVAQLRSGITLSSRGLEAARPLFHRVLAVMGAAMRFNEVPFDPWLFRADTAYRRWAEQLARPAGGPELSFYYGHHAMSAMGAGATQRAAVYLDSARVLQEQALALDSEAIDIRIQLAYTCEFLGRHDDALRENDRALREMPLSRDAYTGAQVLNQRAWLLARHGRVEESIAVLERVMALNTGHEISKQTLRIDESWDALRGNPRFERLIAGN